MGDALRVMEPFTGQGIYFALRTAELAAEAMGNSRNSEAAYSAAVVRLYRERGWINDWLRRLIYHERIAGAVINLLQKWPRLVTELADNVLGEA